jgi:hypothetical protein
MGGLAAEAEPWNGLAHSAMVTVPPLATLYFRQD